MREVILEKAMTLASEIDILEVTAPKSGTAPLTAVTGEIRVPHDGLDIPFSSNVELSFLQACRMDSQIDFVKHQPFSIIFKSANGRKTRTYTPDYYVRKSILKPKSQYRIAVGSPTEILVEVKREEDLRYIKEEDITRFGSAIAWAKKDPKRHFLLFLDTDLSGEMGQRIKRLSNLLDQQETRAARHLKITMKDMSLPTVAEIISFLQFSGFTEAQATDAIWIGLSHGWLGTGTPTIPKKSDRIIYYG